MGLDRDDVCDQLAALEEDDFSTRVASELTGDWLYVFKPDVARLKLYVKIIVRASCVVVSSHEDEGDSDE